MNLTHKLLALSAGLFMLTSCGGGKDHDNAIEGADSAQAQEAIPVTVTDSTKFKFDFAIANIPSPATAMEELGNWHISYDNTILNDPKKAADYSTEFQRSINLGVYNIDMAYAMVSDNGQDVLQYLKPILTLSDALGLKGAMNAMVGKRAEANLSNKDSLLRILDEIFVKSDTYLRTNDRVYTAAIVFAGSWLESLYLTCKINEKVSDPMKEEKARKHLWEQRFHLGNLINLLGDYKDRKECAELIKELKPIHEEIVAVKQPEQMTDSEFRNISSKIYSVRDKLVK